MMVECLMDVSVVYRREYRFKGRPRVSGVAESGKFAAGLFVIMQPARSWYGRNDVCSRYRGLCSKKKTMSGIVEKLMGECRLSA